MTAVQPTDGAVPGLADRVVARFPLVCRSRLTCPDLKTRIEEVRGHALAAEKETEAADQLHRVCVVWNLAALIAADCGIPALAQDLCERQFRLLHAAWPAAGGATIASLQPLVNLARLTHRAGDPRGAYEALLALDQAVNHGGNILLNGKPVSFDAFAATDQDRQNAAEWLRALVREDGTRFLAAAGRWQKAAQHAALGDNRGERLREGRQTHVIAHLLEERADSALALLDASMISEPWEQAVEASLRALADLLTQRLTTEAAARAVAGFQRLRQPAAPADTALFRIRLGLTVADLAAGLCPVQANLLRAELMAQAVASQDAFVAREVLRHQAVRERMTSTENHALTALVHEAGLGRGSIPQPLLNGLLAAVETAEAVLERVLTTAHCPEDMR